MTKTKTSGYLEAPWLSGESWGITIGSMVLRHGFENRLHLITRWKEGPIDGRKSNEKNKGCQIPHQKNLLQYFLTCRSYYFFPEFAWSERLAISSKSIRLGRIELFANRYFRRLHSLQKNRNFRSTTKNFSLRARSYMTSHNTITSPWPPPTYHAKSGNTKRTGNCRLRMSTC